jgi:transcriptional regulator NrdR family protein
MAMNGVFFDGCPECGLCDDHGRPNDRVVRTKPGPQRRRVRECKECGAKWSTREVVVGPVNVKRDA